ncbi:MAG: serine hydrolase domain-containing protein, partial [Spirochaetales bacterium]|nr:serine hydrolase domain-containing protein [Spirochaetales bacterium]
MQQESAGRPASQPREKYAASGFESLVRVFESQIEQGLHAGAQICVRRGTELLCDWWGGMADARTHRPVACSTPFMVYSATKALTAIMIHMLADRGILDLEAPVAHYWPAFACNDKERVT